MSTRRPKTLNVPIPDWYCDRCSAMTSTIKGLRAMLSATGYLHYDKDKLYSSGANGCTLCALVYNNYSVRNVKESQQPLSFFVERDLHNPGEIDNIGYPLDGVRINGLWARNTDGKSKIRLVVSVEEDQPMSKHVTKRPIHQEVANDFAFRKASEWLRQCRDEHNKCAPRGGHPLPKRVIDLTNCLPNAPIRLHISTGKEKDEYAALSHCWGNPDNVTRTTCGNLSARMKTIPYEDQPQTIKDAIFVTRKLGLRYLWVDALCILQDDETDRLTEINVMGSIYRNASITIAAASSSDVTAGFLSKRELRDRNFSMPFLLPDQSLGSIYINLPIYSRDLKTPLETRCWTLQEFLLSPRVLHYGLDEITWHCQTVRFKKMTNNVIDYRPQSMERLPETVFGITASIRRRSRSTQVQIWQALIEQYSQRRATLADDRLPALGGIARELATAWDDTYLAGLWKGCLVSFLGWRRREFHDESLLRDVKAPSWSWASVMAAVEFRQLTWLKAEVIETVVNPLQPETPFGQVDGGEITIRGKMIGAHQLTNVQISGWMFFPDTQIARNGGKHFFFPRDLDPKEQFGHHFYLLLGGNSKRNFMGVRNHVGLVLCATVDGKYRRVGHVYYCDGDLWEGTRTEIVRII